jgi:hypothetical protein
VDPIVRPIGSTSLLGRCRLRRTGWRQVDRSRLLDHNPSRSRNARFGDAAMSDALARFGFRTVCALGRLPRRRSGCGLSLPSGKVIDTGAACVVVDVVAPVEGHPGDGLCHVSIYCETLLTLYFRGRMRGALPPPASRGNRPSVKHSNIPGQCPLRCCDVAHRAVSVCVGFGAYRGARPLLSLNLSRVPGAGP